MGGLLIGLPTTLQPETVFRQQALRQVFSPGGANPAKSDDDTGKDVWFAYDDPISPVTVDLADIPPNEYDGNSQYDRWLRGEIDLDENDRFLSELEVANRQAVARRFPSDKRVQKIESGPGLLSPVLGTHFDSLEIERAFYGDIPVEEAANLAFTRTEEYFLMAMFSHDR